MVAESVFCRMKTSNRIRITKPAISADHNAAARVNLTADSGDKRYSPAVAVGSGGVPFADGTGGSMGRSLEADGSLVMVPSLPLGASKETTPGERGALKGGVPARISI